MTDQVYSHWLGHDVVAGRLITEARALAGGISKSELARRADMSPSAISVYENGRKQPSLPVLLKILAAAGYRLDTRLREDDGHDEALAWHLRRSGGRVG